MNTRTLHPVPDDPSMQRKTGILAMALLSIAYLSHLAFIPLNIETDEARRAIVAAEMMLSGDYISPTINGEIYLNKPPLYNWIIAAFFKLSGGWSMFFFRLPVIIASFGLGFTTYYFVKKYTDRTTAWFAAFAFMTNGRILIYDSFQGLIDVSFAWLVYLQFMLTWSLGEKKKYYSLFLITYFLTALGFLLKGMPALVFQALTLLTYFIYRKQFIRLFHIPHILGILLLLIITGTYYFIYFRHTGVEPLELFNNLWNESTKRTVTKWGWGMTILHLFTFPFEFLYHFAPWTLFVIALFHPGIRKFIRQHPFIQYSALVLLVNIIVYWTSPRIFARYLFMFLPPLFTILFYSYFHLLSKKSWQHAVVKYVVRISIALLLLTFVVLPFVEPTKHVSGVIWKCLTLVIAFSFLLWVIIKYRQWQLYAFVLAVIVFRIGFNWFILEPRAPFFAGFRDTAYQIAEISEGKPLYLHDAADEGNFDGMSFHISTQRGEVLKMSDKLQSGNFYITEDSLLQMIPHTIHIRFKNYLSDTLVLAEVHSSAP